MLKQYEGVSETIVANGQDLLFVATGEVSPDCPKHEQVVDLIAEAKIDYEVVATAVLSYDTIDKEVVEYKILETV